MRATETIDYVLAHIDFGLTQEEFVRLFGDHYVEVEPALPLPGTTSVWRYDAVLEPGYVFESGTGVQMDDVDLAGLKEGKLLYQLFVSFDADGKTRAFTLYYLKSNQIIEYRLSADGGETITVVQS